MLTRRSRKEGGSIASPNDEDRSQKIKRSITPSKSKRSNTPSKSKRSNTPSKFKRSNTPSKTKRSASKTRRETTPRRSKSKSVERKLRVRSKSKIKSEPIPYVVLERDNTIDSTGNAKIIKSDY